MAVQELVFFRDDIMRKMRLHSRKPAEPADDEEMSEELRPLSSQLFTTLCDQVGNPAFAAVVCLHLLLMVNALGGGG